MADPVLEEEADLVVFVEKVCSAEEEGEAVLVTVGKGRRESVMEREGLRVPRRVILTEEVPVGVWLS